MQASVVLFLGMPNHQSKHAKYKSDSLSILSRSPDPYNGGAFGSIIHWSTLMSCFPVAFASWMNSRR